MRVTRRWLLGSVGVVSVLPALAHAGGALPAASSPFEMVLRLGVAQPGPGNHRWARISAGLVAGDLQGHVQSGRIDWHVDPASGAAEAMATCSVRCADGRLVQLRRANLAATRLDNGLVRLRAF